MPEHVTATPSPATASTVEVPPAWLRERFLGPTEVMRWWSGTRERPTQEWLKNHEGLVFGLGFGGFFVLPFVGALLCALVRLDPGGGFFFGAILGIAVLGTACTVLGTADKHTWSVLTDRRLFVVEGRKKKHDFDLELLRRFLQAAGPSGEGALDDRVMGLGELRAVPSGTKTGPSEGITDVGSLLVAARLIEQIQGAKKGGK